MLKMYIFKLKGSTDFFIKIQESNDVLYQNKSNQQRFLLYSFDPFSFETCRKRLSGEIMHHTEVVIDKEQLFDPNAIYMHFIQLLHFYFVRHPFRSNTLNIWPLSFQNQMSWLSQCILFSVYN